MLTVFMLNPSTANETQADQTVSRLERFVGDWGFGGFEVVNAFSIVSTDASALRRQMKIGGRTALIRDETDAHVRYAVERSGITLVAWGGNMDHPALSRPHHLVVCAWADRRSRLG